METTKHAYLILANGNIHTLKVCLRLIDNIKNDIFILFDKKANISSAVRDSLKLTLSYSNLVFLPDMIVNWGGWSQVKAPLELIKNAKLWKRGGVRVLSLHAGSRSPDKIARSYS